MRRAASALTGRNLSLDRIDRKILHMLQTDNRIANINLAERAGLSPPACSRRVARLRETGIIARDVSILNPQKAGKTVKVVVAVTLGLRQKAALEAFQDKMLGIPEILQCFMIAGPIDFYVVAALDDVESYAGFAADVFADDENIISFESWVVLKHVKDETRLPLPGLD